MAPSKLKNITKYKNQPATVSLSEEPLISFNADKKAFKENIQTLLHYTGTQQVSIPGAFLSLVTEITSLPVSFLIEILDISKSTFYRVKEDEYLEQSTVDKLASILKIYNRGLKAFNDKNDLVNWMRSSVITLDGEKPIELLKTENGRNTVLNAIERIEHGVYG